MGPTFVFGCSWRCGSTLLQRIINSSGKIFIWGEHAGLISSCARAYDELITLQPLADRQAQSLAIRGEQAWVANLTPPLALLSDAFRGMLVSYYEPPTRAKGIERWGFKEVRYDANVAKFLLSLFPEGRVLFLVRHPVDVIASNAANDWYSNIGGEEAVLEQWKRSCQSFADQEDERVLCVRYEDLVSNPSSTLKDVAEHIELHQNFFSPSALKSKVRGAKNQPASVSPEKIEQIAYSLKDLLNRYGYVPGARGCLCLDA